MALLQGAYFKLEMKKKQDISSTVSSTLTRERLLNLLLVEFDFIRV